MMDLSDVGDIDITVDETGRIWVNIDGKCVLRVQHAKTIQIDDPLRGMDIVYGESNDL